MNTHTQKDEIALWQMYIWSGTKAIQDLPDADGITILRTARGSEYRFPLYMKEPFVDSVQQAVDTLTQKDDTQVLYLVHIWKNHWLDLPSRGLREALTALHSENKHARMMLIGEESFVILSVEDSLAKA